MEARVNIFFLESICSLHDIKKSNNEICLYSDYKLE